MSRLVVVSNRVPVPSSTRAPQGGLATAVFSALETRGGLWFGWNGRLSEEKEVARTRYGNVDFATTALSRRDYDDYYRGYSNRVMWPLLHARLERMEYRRSFENGYRRVNQFLADGLVPLLRPDDTIWIHDYHLIPLGLALRRAGCQQRIGFFLHTPFPPADVFRALPHHRTLLLELGVYDLIGFQTDVDLRGFLDSVHDGVPGAVVNRTNVVIGNGPTRTGVFPISVDVDDVAALAVKGRNSASGRRLISSVTDRRLVLGVDRLDYSKGLVERFRAYERLLESHAAMRRNVIYLQVAQPSRGDLPEYQYMRRALDTAAGQINGRFAEYDWVPLRYLHKGFARATILGFLSISRVGLVTPLRDGMNLVAKEYVAAQSPENPGALVLSELAGAARELDAAVIVNPYDIDDVAEGLAKAIEMSREERRERWESMMKVLRRNDIHRWQRDFLETLDSAHEATTFSTAPRRPREQAKAAAVAPGKPWSGMRPDTRGSGRNLT